MNIPGRGGPTGIPADSSPLLWLPRFATLQDLLTSRNKISGRDFASCSGRREAVEIGKSLELSGWIKNWAGNGWGSHVYPLEFCNEGDKGEPYIRPRPYKDMVALPI